MNTAIEVGALTFFDPMKAPMSILAETFASNIADLLLETERSTKPRKRNRKHVDQAIFDKQVAALVANLAEQVITREYRDILIQRSHSALGSASRYKPSFLTKALTSVLDLMEEAGLIHQEIGRRSDNPFAIRGEATKLAVAGDFADMVDAAGLELSDFGKLPLEETVILKDAKASRWDKGKRKEYLDTEQTHAWREEMRLINGWLAEADIRYFGQPLRPDQRHLQRIFTGGTFDQCGRLYGGLWQGLTKVQRKGSLTINGESIVCLDYGQMLLRSAYSHAGVQPPEGDMYVIEPWGERYREGFKKLISAMLFRTSPMKRKPKGTASLLPPMNVSQLTGSVRRAHPGIAHLFSIGLGHQLMHTESTILVSVLLRLRELNIIALPIHDAVLVPESAFVVTHQVMTKVFTDRLAINCVVSSE